MNKTNIEYDEYMEVWTLSEGRARHFFGVGDDATVVVLKERPTTTREIEQYRADAVLYGVKRTPDSSAIQQAAAEASRVARGLHAEPGPHCVACGKRLTVAEAAAQPPDHDEVCVACGGPSPIDQVAISRGAITRRLRRPPATILPAHGRPGTLKYLDGDKTIREATQEETDASIRAGWDDDGDGIISVNGIKAYVDGGESMWGES